MALAAKRVAKDLEKLLNDPPPGITCHYGSTPTSIRAFILGPEDTPYYGGTFEVCVTIPKAYPIKPPGIKFVTKIIHCNISKGGDVCLDFLQNKWAASCTLGGALTTVRCLLSDANPDSPLNCDAAKRFRKNRQAHDLYVRRHVHQYAGGPNPDAPAGDDIASGDEVVEPPVGGGGGGGGGGDASRQSDSFPVIDLSCDEAVPPPRREKRSRDEGEESASKRTRGVLETLAAHVRDGWAQRVREKTSAVQDLTDKDVEDMRIPDLNYHDPVAVANRLFGGLPQGLFCCADVVMMLEEVKKHGELIAKRLEGGCLGVAARHDES